MRVGDGAVCKSLDAGVKDSRAGEHALGTYGPNIPPAAFENCEEGSQHGHVASALLGWLGCFDAADKAASGIEVVRLERDALEAGEGVGDDLEELGYHGAADAPENCCMKKGSLVLVLGFGKREGRGGDLRIMERMSNVSSLS